MTQPTLTQLQAFVAVCEHEGFSAAADELGMSQPAVSQQIRLLETSLGVQLFERRPRGTVVSGAGEVLLPFARQALAAVDAITVEAERQRTGVTRIRLAAIPTIAPYLLPSVIAQLKQEHPGARLSVAEMRTTEIVDALTQGALDLAIIATDEDSAAIASTVVQEDPFLLAVPEGDVLAARKRVHPDVLADRDVLLLQDGHCLRGQAQEVCQRVDGARTQDVSASGLTTVCQMVAAGQGVTLLPRIAVEIECRAGSGIAVIALTGSRGRIIRIAWRRTSALATQWEAMSVAVATALRS